VLFNASPDVRTQLATAPALTPHGLRGSPVRAVVLTNADIDHAAGLLVLREGGAPPIYCTDRVEEALTIGLSILPTLSAYGPVLVRRVVSGETQDVCDRDGTPTGVRIRAFVVASKPSPYMAGKHRDDPRGDLAGDTVGYAITTASSSDVLLYVPGVRDLDDALAQEIAASRCVLIDGTFSTDNELIDLGASAKTSRMMGHAPLFGDNGLVDFLSKIQGPRKIVVHINNSNPMLRNHSNERAQLSQHNIEVAHDGLEVSW
jgi:pyrroloquinoline quinone biosynthesis protein B